MSDYAYTVTKFPPNKTWGVVRLDDWAREPQDPPTLGDLINRYDAYFEHQGSSPEIDGIIDGLAESIIQYLKRTGPVIKGTNLYYYQQEDGSDTYQCETVRAAVDQYEQRIRDLDPDDPDCADAWFKVEADLSALFGLPLAYNVELEDPEPLPDPLPSMN